MSDHSSLAGPLARIERADELVTDLEKALRAFLSDRPYTVEERRDDNPQARTFVVTSLRDIPARPRVIAGEIAHHLRASLDLLAYQLLLNAGINDENRLASCAFPGDHEAGFVEPRRQEKARRVDKRESWRHPSAGLRPHRRLAAVRDEP